MYVIEQLKVAIRTGNAPQLSVDECQMLLDHIKELQTASLRKLITDEGMLDYPLWRFGRSNGFAKSDLEAYSAFIEAYADSLDNNYSKQEQLTTQDVIDQVNEELRNE